jgi:hypothetical protein
MSSLEAKMHQYVRDDTFALYGWAVFFVGLALLVGSLPLLITHTADYLSAESVCKERRVLTGDAFAEGFASNSTLLPSHTLNMLSVGVSLLSLLLWALCSPHDSEHSEKLDMCLGSYFFFQLVSKLFVAVAQVGSVCTASKSGYAVAEFSYILCFFSFSVVATNLLCHRYLLEKSESLERAM